jgi:diaminohydroxyphosphoribosylaminopyrimidine deaminase/5-amino-6-(5-phosphoribosylamino)uracil reductase
MRQALALAELGLGHTSPNPPVGCVIVRDGTVLGTGYHRRLGELHAEAAALGATCYATLEPCVHVGRQPACATALIEADVARVVYGCDDTDSRTAGLAADLFAQHSIEVTTGVLQGECEELLDGYLFAKQHERAFMHLKLANSLDGKVATAAGRSQWLSGPESLGLAHYLRQKHDAILVGVGTVLADDPRLSTRIEQLRDYRPELAAIEVRSPVRVVLDPALTLAGRLDSLRLAQFAGMRGDLPRLVLIAQRGLASPELATELRRREGVLVLLLDAEYAAGGAQPRLSFARIAQELYVLGIQSVLVEGGGSVAAHLLAQRAVDRLTCVVTPVLLGADALGFSPVLALTEVADGMRLERVRIERLGDDTAISGVPQWPTS